MIFFYRCKVEILLLIPYTCSMYLPINSHFTIYPFTFSRLPTCLLLHFSSTPLLPSFSLCQLVNWSVFFNNASLEVNTYIRKREREVFTKNDKPGVVWLLRGTVYWVTFIYGIGRYWCVCVFSNEIYKDHRKQDK